MFEDITALFMSTGFGGLIGSVFSFLNKKEAAKQRIAEMAHERAMRDSDLEELRISQSHEVEMAKEKREIVETEGKVATDLKAAEGFVESIKVGMKAVGIAWVDAIRSLMRPFITVFALGVSTFIAVRTGTLVGGLESLPETELFALYLEIVKSILMIAMASAMWWFGSRPDQVSKK